jgi:hypothetical protein
MTIIENFAKGLLQSKIFETYAAAGFFGTLIFFVVNFAYYTPIEMMFGIVFATIVFKGLANIMLAMNISLVNLDNQQDKVEFEKASNKLESLVKDLAIQEAAIQSSRTVNNHKG